MMPRISPLRYPGGKTAFADVLRQIRHLNGLGGFSLAEPFAGGAGASLSLLCSEEVSTISINDIDKAVYSFWWSIVNRYDEFSRKLRSVKLTISEWRKQRQIYRAGNASRIELGFAAFYLNRCNRSGIIANGGPIGGIKQSGSWTLDARFNKEELLRRCSRIAEFSERINLSQVDAIRLLAGEPDIPTLFFIDPPYFHKGKVLYLNSLNANYHRALSLRVKKLESPWVMTYDDCPEVRQLYDGWANVRSFSLKYAASVNRSGRELLITPRWMKLPQRQISSAIGW